MRQLEIRRMTKLVPEIHVLEQQAQDENFRFVTRLISEWNSGENRFDAPGECLLAGYIGHNIVAIGGISIDPYASRNIARVRRFYVTPGARRQKIGGALLAHLIEHAGLHFHSLRVFTDTQVGEAFYLRNGFERIDDQHATHAMSLITDSRARF